MFGRSGADRLAVRTYTELGEEVAFGDPSVTDEQRAAAGRETVAECSRALLVENRRRAGERYAAGAEAGAEEATRVWFPRDPAALRSRLGGDELAVWAEHDILHVLWPVQGSDDLWEASLRIRRLNEAVISIIVVAQQGDDLPFGAAAAAQTVWRGPRAPDLPPVATPLTGTIETHMIDSVALGARAVTVYRPPGHEGRLPVCVLADGQSVPGFAGVLEPAVLLGAAPAVLLVGVHNAIDPGRAGVDGRSREYLPGHDRRRFGAHLRFVTDEVIQWLSDRGHSPRSVVAAGCSNGAAWAIAAAQRRPDMFTAVAALSPGVVPAKITAAARTAGTRHYLASGVLEPGFRRATQEWANRLQRARMPCRHHEWVGGHDHEWWQQQLPIALEWLLRPQAT